MLGPAHPQLPHEQALEDLRELVLAKVGRRRVIARLLPLIGKVDAAAGLEVHVEEVDVLELHPRPLAEEVLDELVDGDRGLGSPVGHGGDAKGDRAPVVQLLVVPDRVVALLRVRQRAHLDRLQPPAPICFSSASVLAAWPFW
jgi:hypothetical protein